MKVEPCKAGVSDSASREKSAHQLSGRWSPYIIQTTVLSKNPDFLRRMKKFMIEIGAEFSKSPQPL